MKEEGYICQDPHPENPLNKLSGKRKKVTVEFSLSAHTEIFVDEEDSEEHCKEIVCESLHRILDAEYRGVSIDYMEVY